jgi:hypothetical protein
MPISRQSDILDAALVGKVRGLKGAEHPGFAAKHSNVVGRSARNGFCTALGYPFELNEALMTRDLVARWAEAHPLPPIHVDCAVAVMLKILDGKCKMRESEKLVMALLYDAVRDRPGQILGADIHALIAEARAQPGEALKNLVYEKRVLAETAISRPVMKGFKAMIRQTGLLDGAHDAEDEAA